MAEKSKAERRKEIIEKRVTKALRSLTSLGNLNSYKLTPEEVEKICKVVTDKATKELARMAEQEPKAREGFTFDEDDDS